MRKITCLVLAMLLTLSLAACGGKTETTATTAAASSSTGVEDGVLTIAMECASSPAPAAGRIFPCAGRICAATAQYLRR